MELGGGNLIPGFEEGLLGASAGETRTVELSFPADYGDEQLAGRDASFEITVKEVKDKRLPELDEDFAIDAGFDSVEELREDIRRPADSRPRSRRSRTSSARPRSTRRWRRRRCPSPRR